MYKLIQKQDNLSLRNIFNDFSFYALQYNHKEDSIPLLQYNKDSNLIWESNVGKVSSVSIDERWTLLLTKENGFYKLDTKTKKTLHHYKTNFYVNFYGDRYVCDNLLIATDLERKYFLFDLDTFQVLKKYPQVSNTFGILKFIKNCFIVNNYALKKGIYQVYNTDMELLWERDFNIDCTYTDFFGDVNAAQLIKVYPLDDDKMIVLFNGGHSFCLEIKTGKQIWYSKGWADFFLRISEEEAYTFSNAGSIRKVCLRTGTFLQPKDKYYRLPALTKEQGGIDIYLYSEAVSYHDGLLWFVTNASGLTYIVAVNPHDFHYEWVQKVESRAEIDRVFFNGNRMYLNSKNYELLIYEKV